MQRRGRVPNKWEQKKTINGAPDQCYRASSFFLLPFEIHFAENIPPCGDIPDLTGSCPPTAVSKRRRPLAMHLEAQFYKIEDVI